jgi:hypothetical protein
MGNEFERKRDEEHRISENFGMLDDEECRGTSLLVLFHDTSSV